MRIFDRILGRKDPTDALFSAAAASNVVEVRKALLRGADVNAQEASEGQSPLHVVCRRSWRSRHVDQGMAIRVRAGLSDTSNTVHILLEAGAQPGSADNDGVTPLHWVSGKGMTNIVRLLTGAGADVNAVDEHSYTPLHQAAGAGHLEAARALIEAGADVNVRSSHGETPLTFAEGLRAVDSDGRDPTGPLKNLLLERGGIL